MDRTVGTQAGGGPRRSPHGEQPAPLTLGIAPVCFSDDRVRIGRIAPATGLIRALRRQHARTHAFRFDARYGMIVNIGLGPGIEPMGEIDEVTVGGHLLLLAEAIGCQLRHWVSGRRTILRRFRPLVCLGSRDRLLTRALRELGMRAPDTRLDVVAKWSFDVRMLSSADPDERPYLGLLVDVATANLIDLPVSELIEKKVDPIGCYVGAPKKSEDRTELFHMRILGRVRSVEGKRLLLEDVRGDSESSWVESADVRVEARPETLEDITRTFYPSVADRALMRLRRIRMPYLSGDGKLRKLRQMVDDLNTFARMTGDNSLNLRLTDGVDIEFGTLLDQSSRHFPLLIETSRPPMLFGASGHDQHTQPDLGIRRHGPFQYALNATNDPTIVVLCNKDVKGRMEQFAKSLRDGVAGYNGRFAGGLIGKFRLTNVQFHFLEVSEDTAQGYVDAARSALEDLPQIPALALVQVREAHKFRIAEQNPYYVAKSHFMRSGVPVQAVRLETIDNSRGRAYSLNNLALASYAKIGGIPWVISARGVATHELVIGIGSTEVGSRRLGARTRYVGITTLFQGDGRYLV